MAGPVLILVQGVPGTGKTTLSRRLAKDLAIPCIGKDDIKELLFDRLGIGDAQWSNDQGAAAADMLLALIDTLTGRGWCLIAESAYFVSFATPRLRKIVKDNGVACLEVLCYAQPAVRRQRFEDRRQRGDRHPGHVDVGVELTDAEIEARYGVIGVGDTLVFDMTVIDEVKYTKLLGQIRDWLAKHKKENA